MHPGYMYIITKLEAIRNTKRHITYSKLDLATRRLTARFEPLSSMALVKEKWVSYVQAITINHHADDSSQLSDIYKTDL